MKRNCLSFYTKFGWISIFEKKQKISEVKFQKIKKCKSNFFLQKSKVKFINFFSKNIKIINTPHIINGNVIQKKIWSELKRIKFGQTKTYGEIARKLDISPRLVGKVCGQNKLLLIVPCHRVIRSDGKLGGFSAKGGIKLKKKLLEFENLLS